MQNIRTRLAKLAHRDERGISLVEILVYVTILAVLLSGIVALVVSSNNASSRLATTTATQAEVNNAQTAITRDLSLTQQIFNAGGNHIQFAVLQENKQYRVTIFSWEGSTTASDLPGYITTLLNDNPDLSNKLPTEPAVMSIREEYGNPDAKTITALTTGYDPLAYESQGLWLFSYYDKANEMIPLNSDKQFDNPAQEVGEISRIAFRIAADAPGRASKVQAESSVTPPLNKTNISSELTNGKGSLTDQTIEPPECPIIEANIPRNTRAAVISWTQVTGATQLYITRSEFRNNVWTEQRTYTIDNPSLTSFTEPANELSIGATYRYRIDLETVRGNESCGQTTSVSVIPSATNLRNINPHAYARTMEGLTANNLTGVNAAGTANTLNSDLTVRGVNRSAATVNPLASARYTVARGLSNQVAFGGTYGALEYIVYRDGTEITRIPANTTGSSVNEPNQRYSFIDANQSYGDVHNYHVVARNAGGNNIGTSNDGYALTPSATTLISPPTRNSVLTVVANDNEVVSNGNVLSSNTLTVTATNNVAGFRAKYATSETVANCAVGIPQTDATGNAVGYRNDDNISVAVNSGYLSTVNSTVLTQTGIGWGTSTCYRMIPFNDAGSYPYAEGAANDTSRVVANQRPERFQVTNVSSGTYFYNADYSESARLNSSVYIDISGRAECLLYSGPNKDQFGTDQQFCDGRFNKTYTGGPWGTGNWSPIGGIIPQQGQHQMFRNQNYHQIYGTQQEVIGRWGVSQGARAGYNLVRTVENAPTGRGTIVGYSNVKTESIPYATGNETNNGIRFSGEFPGVVMSISMNSNALNGLSRTGVARVTPANTASGTTNKYMFATNPAPSLSLRGGYFAQYHWHGSTTATQEMSRPSHGHGGVAYLTATINGALIANNMTADVTSSNYRFYTDGFVGGQLVLFRKITWNAGLHGTLQSSEFRGSGNINGSPTWRARGFWHEGYNQYWGNMSGRYEGRSALNASTDYDSYWPNTRTILRSGQTIENISNVVGSTDLPATMIVNCATIREGDPGYLDNNCEYGQGIAPAPGNLAAVRTGATTYQISWNTVEAATSYRVIVMRGATQVLNTTTTNLSSVLNNVTQGTSYTVTVKAINPTGEGEEATVNFTSTSVPAAVNNLTVTQQATPTTWRATWTASTGATSYTAELFQGTTLVQTGTSTTPVYNFTNVSGSGVTYRVVITPRNLAGAGTVREVTFTTPVIVVAGPTGTMNMTQVTNTTANTYSPSSVSATGMTCASPAVLQSQIRTGATTLKAYSTTHSVNIPANFPKNTPTQLIVDWRCVDEGINSAVVTRNGLTITHALNAPIASAPAAPSLAASTWVTKNANAYTVQYKVNHSFTMQAITCTTGWTPEYVVTDGTTRTTQSSNVYVKNIQSGSGSTSLSYTVGCKNTSTGELSAKSGASTAASVTGANFTVPAPLTAVAVSKANPIPGENVTFTFPDFQCPTGSTKRYVVWFGSWVGEPTELTARTYTRNFTAGEAASMNTEGIWYASECVFPDLTFISSDISATRYMSIITTPAAPTAAPTVGAMVNQTAQLSWTAVPGATSYRISAAGKNGAARVQTVTGTSANVIYPSGLPGDTVSFRIQAVNAAGTSAQGPVRTVNALRGDYTGDGNPDLMANTAAGDSRLYPGNGTGGFTSGHFTFGTGWNGFQKRADADMNNDGRLDIVSYHAPAGEFYLYTYEGTPNGTNPGTRTTIRTGVSNAILFGLADYNRDANIDVLYSQGSNLYMLPGNGNGTFGAPVSLASGVPTVTAVGGTADYNGDGRPDVLTKHNNYLVMWVSNLNNNNLTRAFQTGTGWETVTHLEAWDTNADGRADNVARNTSNAGLFVYRHTTSAVNTDFNLVVTAGSGWNIFQHFAASKDWNRDGRIDIIGINTNSSGSYAGELWFYPGISFNGTSGNLTGQNARVGTGWSGFLLWDNIKTG